MPEPDDTPISTFAVLDLWRCPICGDAWTAHGENAHCAGSSIEGTRHESVACLRVKALLIADATAQVQLLTSAAMSDAGEIVHLLVWGYLRS